MLTPFRRPLRIISADDARVADRPGVAAQARRTGSGDRAADCCSGRTLGLIFEKPSLRTRVSFEAAMARLGGNAIFLRGKDVGLGIRESVADFARVISQYVDALAVRTFAHATVEELARYGASRSSTPCRTLAPLPGDGRHGDDRAAEGTVEGREARVRGRRQQRGPVAGAGLGLLGVEFVLAAPPGYEFPAAFRAAVRGQVPPTPAVVDPTRGRRSTVPTSSTPTSGRAWARNTRPRSGGRSSAVPGQ